MLFSFGHFYHNSRPYLLHGLFKLYVIRIVNILSHKLRL